MVTWQELQISPPTAWPWWGWGLAIMMCPLRDFDSYVKGMSSGKTTSDFLASVPEFREQVLFHFFPQKVNHMEGAGSCPLQGLQGSWRDWVPPPPSQVPVRVGLRGLCHSLKHHEICDSRGHLADLRSHVLD